MKDSKRSFELLVIPNLIIYAFFGAIFFKGGLSYAENLPILKNLPAEFMEKKVAMQASIKEVASWGKDEIIDKPKSNNFPWGQCTWYVASKRNVTWNGHAYSWFDNARLTGRPVGKTPKVGSIVVLNQGYYGHVGYVEMVKGNIITYSESNNPNPGKITRQTVDYRKLPLIGFIY